ncbi:MAG: S41 family peptidase [Muribaculaceae bacterium]|nr:S41 family peptidase [Muribaculaceae bacterium]
MKEKRNIAYVLLPVVLCAGLIGGIFIGKFVEKRTISPTQEKLQTILDLINTNYVDKIDVDSLMEATFPDLIAGLDPHSAYIPKEDLTMTNDELEGSFGGVGVSFQIINDTVYVIEVVSGGPAEKVGIQPGDRIIEAGGKALSGVKASTDDVFSTLRGKEGTNVKVKIKRSNSKDLLDYDITRGAIPSNSVDAAYMLEDNVGYVKVSKFARTTYAEFVIALAKLRQEGAEKYIVDLRNNSGGFMDQAAMMANEFLPEGKMIVFTKGRRPENESMIISTGEGNFQDVEVTVLTNEMSASASEIFAGALQDNDRGVVIGRRSFGKGLVQNQTELPDSSAIRLTVARYYTPSGRCIQKDYTLGKDGKYQLDIVDRYNHGEFYSPDSIKFDESKRFTTVGGRVVYGGGGIMPDVFVPEDTVGYTSYYIEAINRGLIQRFCHEMAEKYRPLMKEKTIAAMNRIVPREDSLLTLFVDWAANNGLPARWYYINESRGLLLNQLRAVLARDLLGFDAYIRILNERDPAVEKAHLILKNGESEKMLKSSAPNVKPKGSK